jgi:subtilisin family serine protease
MPASDDWNLKMVRSREARALLPQTAPGSGVVAWGKLRVGHLDTGYTPHPIVGDLAGRPGVAPVEGEEPGSFAIATSSHGGGFGKGSGTSYATVHVAAAAAMWLVKHRARLDAAYPEPWQRVEAFRRLLRDTRSPINGAPPANGSGVLDIEALLKAALPAKADLRKAPEDKDKWA